MTSSRSVVGANIKAEMARRGVTQAALADHLGMTQQAVSNKIAGTRPIPTDELVRIAAFLNVDETVLTAGARAAVAS